MCILFLPRKQVMAYRKKHRFDWIISYLKTIVFGLRLKPKSKSRLTALNGQTYEMHQFVTEILISMLKSKYINQMSILMNTAHFPPKLKLNNAYVNCQWKKSYQTTIVSNKQYRHTANRCIETVALLVLLHHYVFLRGFGLYSIFESVFDWKAFFFSDVVGYMQVSACFAVVVFFFESIANNHLMRHFHWRIENDTRKRIKNKERKKKKWKSYWIS